MPIYEFKCDQCGKEFEELSRSNEAAPSCPDCGATTHKLMSACRRVRNNSGGDYSYKATAGGGCAGCSGGNCGSCGR